MPKKIKLPKWTKKLAKAINRAFQTGKVDGDYEDYIKQLREEGESNEARNDNANQPPKLTPKP